MGLEHPSNYIPTPHPVQCIAGHAACFGAQTCDSVVTEQTNCLPSRPSCQQHRVEEKLSNNPKLQFPPEQKRRVQLPALRSDIIASTALVSEVTVETAVVYNIRYSQLLNTHSAMQY